ncbi:MULTISPECIES: phage minor head protein [Pseudomonas]|jgi:SPP1 gp7 family putative phage head morphogenesis protein|uniref:phage head morphogenesis protein n=1 Tax=Pseudomonas TaxID=286 RepID=UPI0006D43F1B|nr:MULTISPECIES: phage minor head protein [Pseudomonas]MBV2081455.1 minor capsid protein [Pseudomonas carnis]MBV2087557.1 minor capsid protein [Pseudomonas carnis]MCP9731863.1 phage minor head protein [Pseudomonas sp. GBPI_506]MDO3691266.1 phage minor head protein [Pseudomonas sp. DKN 2791]MDO7032901.1 phage minor head protein [Pseudomonas sp. DKN 2792]
MSTTKTPNPADLKAIFGLEPEQAIAYLKSKGYAITWNWQEMVDQAHDISFTVAKAMRLDLLSDIRGALETALQSGQTLKQFIADLQPVLESQGWWGKQVIVDSQGVGEMVQLGSPRRLKTIYQTNLQSAYMAGRKASMEETTDTHPYWMYVAILDGKTRPSHRALHGQVFRHDDPIWASIFPPNGFNCRCRVVALTESAVKRRGLRVVSSEGNMFTETVETGVNKRTGEIRTAEVTGLRTTDAAGKAITFRTDPGFNHAPGTGLAEILKRKQTAA